MTIVVPKRILAMNARHLRRETTRILNPVTCMEQNPSIRTTRARVIQKNQASLITTFKNVDMMRIMPTIAITAVGTIPQRASAILPFRATGKSRTSRVTTRSPTRITLLITLQKRGGWSRKTVWVTSPQLKKRVKHLWSLIRE